MSDVLVPVGFVFSFLAVNRRTSGCLCVHRHRRRTRFANHIPPRHIHHSQSSSSPPIYSAEPPPPTPSTRYLPPVRYRCVSCFAARGTFTSRGTGRIIPTPLCDLRRSLTVPRRNIVRPTIIDRPLADDSAPNPHPKTNKRKHNTLDQAMPCQPPYRRPPPCRLSLAPPSSSGGAVGVDDRRPWSLLLRGRHRRGVRVHDRRLFRRVGVRHSGLEVPRGAVTVRHDNKTI